MALHGATIGMDAMFPGTGNAPSSEWTTVAEEDSVLLVVPNATQQTGVVWNDCTPLPEVGGTPDDAGFLVRLTDWITDRAAVNPDRAYVYGGSNGGQMANRLAIEHPGRYAGIAAFISNINSNLGADEECPTPAKSIPVLTVSGKRDRTTPFDGGGADVWGEELLSAEATRDFWVDNNVQDDPPSPQPVEYTEALSTVSCTRTPAPDTGADVQLCTFERGHKIPSKPSFDFESARLAWRFFRDRWPLLQRVARWRGAPACTKGDSRETTGVCRGWDSNPHGTQVPTDFKSVASATSATPATHFACRP